MWLWLVLIVNVVIYTLLEHLFELEENWLHTVRLKMKNSKQAVKKISRSWFDIFKHFKVWLKFTNSLHYSGVTVQLYVGLSDRSNCLETNP